MKQSAWEILTGGQCNNALPLEQKKRKSTARVLKDLERARVHTLERKFDKLAALDAVGTPEARKEKRKMSDQWTKRASRNTGQLFDRAAARAAKRNQVTVTQGARA